MKTPNLSTDSHDMLFLRNQVHPVKKILPILHHGPFLRSMHVLPFSKKNAKYIYLCIIHESF